MSGDNKIMLAIEKGKHDERRLLGTGKIKPGKTVEEPGPDGE